MRGVPVRLEIGPKDVANQAVMSVRRDTRAKESIPLASLAERLPALLADIQATLFTQAEEFRAQNTTLASSKADVLAHFEADRRGFVAAPWDGSAAFEAEVKEKTGATLRCVPFDLSRFTKLEKPGHRVALFARSY
jgi:prolyl-tRNA synthetase